MPAFFGGGIGAEGIDKLGEHLFGKYGLPLLELMHGRGMNRS